MPSIFVPVGYALTLTANATSAGSYYRINTPGTDPSDYNTFVAGATTILGPFNEPRYYNYDSNNGEVDATVGFSGSVTAVDDAAIALLAPKASPTFTGVPILPTPFKIGAVSMTATGTELNYVVGVTSAVQTQINAKEALLSGGGVKAAGASGTAGSFKSFPATGSKGSLAVVAVANTGDTITTISNAAMGQASVISIPDPGAATDSFVLKAANDTALANKQAVVSGVSDTEIGYLDGVSSAIQTQIDAKKPTVVVANVGAANTGTTAVERGDANFHISTLTVSSTLPAITGGADQAVGKLLYTFPAGSIIVKACYMSMAITQSEAHINADTPDVGIGTTIGSGANALLSDVGAAAENLLTGQSANNCTGTAEVKTVADQILVIEAGGDHTVYFNAADGWAADGDTAAAIAGTVVLEWQFMA